LAHFPTRSSPGRPLCALRYSDQHPSFRQESPTGSGQFRAARQAAKKRRSQLLLKRADLQAKRRLAYSYSLGCPREIQFFGDRQEIPDVTQFHTVIAKSYRSGQ